jgi:endonuclease/exonuclease/phosphatase family metal-dependent hydrolase
LINICNPLLTNYTLLTGNKNKNQKDSFFQATYIRDDVEIIDHKLILDVAENTGLGIFSKIKNGGHPLNLCNFHGLAYPGNKMDTPERLTQSEGIINFFKDISGSIIIGGDFNLDPSTESIKKFEISGYRNLVMDLNIPTTRNKIAWEKYPDDPQLYCDYVFVSPDINVQNFTVPSVIVSDHQPLILEIGE